MARVIVEPPPAWNQDATQLALMVANGSLDIVEDAEFDKGKPHKEVWREINARERERAMRMGQITDTRDELAEMRAMMARQAEEIKELKAAAAKK